MPLKIALVPITETAEPPAPPEIGRTPVATYSLHRGATPPPRNFAVLAIARREVVAVEAASPQGDPLPILMI